MATERMFVVVDAPTQRPPRGATLLRSANPVTEADDRWLAGLTYVPEACGEDTAALAAGYCGTGFAGWPDADSVFPLGEALTFVPPYVAVAQRCSAIGGEPAVRAVGERAGRLLEACATVGIARELWRGDVAQSEGNDNDFLAKAGSFTDVGGGSPLSVLTAFAELEQGLADCSCGGVGMIHASVRTATLWSHLDLLERLPDGRLISALGTVVVADPGYDGSDSAGAAGDADGSWAYATTMVDVRLGPVDTLADRNLIRETNDFAVYAFRAFAATFDPCCHLAAQIDHTTLT